tara:strand:+ start:217 stop:588 length:372 start_codon:yes stop_codon:yes gene_type:complete
MKIVEIAPMAVSAKKAMDLKKMAADQQKNNQAQGTSGTTGTVKPGETNPNNTIGNNTSTNQNKMDYARGQMIDVPNADNPQKPEKYKVKAVTGNEVELVPNQNKPGIPSSLKFKKSDLPKLSS